MLEWPPSLPALCSLVVRGQAHRASVTTRPCTAPDQRQCQLLHGLLAHPTLPQFGELSVLMCFVWDFATLSCLFPIIWQQGLAVHGTQCGRRTTPGMAPDTQAISMPHSFTKNMHSTIATTCLCCPSHRPAHLQASTVSVQGRCEPLARHCHRR